MQKITSPIPITPNKIVLRPMKNCDFIDFPQFLVNYQKSNQQQTPPGDVISSKIRLILSGRPTRTARTPSFRRPMAMSSTAGLPRQETTGATTDVSNGSFKNKNIGISLRNFEILANWMRRMSEICSLTENSSAIRCDPQMISTWLGIPWKRSSPVAPTGDLQLFSPNSSNHVLGRNHMFDTLVYDNPIVDTFIHTFQCI